MPLRQLALLVQGVDTPDRTQTPPVQGAVTQSPVSGAREARRALGACAVGAGSGDAVGAGEAAAPVRIDHADAGSAVAAGAVVVAAADLADLRDVTAALAALQREAVGVGLAGRPGRHGGTMAAGADARYAGRAVAARGAGRRPDAQDADAGVAGAVHVGEAVTPQPRRPAEARRRRCC